MKYLLSFATCLSLLACAADGAPGNSCQDPTTCPACADEHGCPQDGVWPRFYLGDDGAFFDQPWPSDLRLSATGHLSLGNFPNPSGSSMLAAYVDTIERETRGFGPNAAIYFAFHGALDPQSLPASPTESLSPQASVLLIDVSDGPHRGERFPFHTRYFPDERQFTPAYTLVLRPVAGIPLRERTRYAACVTRRVRSVDGRPLGASGTFERLKHQTPPDGALRPAYNLFSPVFKALEELALLPRSEVVACAIFTTQAIFGELDAVQAMIAAAPPPVAERWARLDDRQGVSVFEAWFSLPELQSGAPPDFEGGGGFVFDTTGAPVVQRLASVPLVLAVPEGPPPIDGFPLVVYAHGTGGSRLSFLDEGVATLLAARGIASLSIDQPLHGERNPWGRNEDIITFNPYNILAMRDNFRQGAVDLMALWRLLPGLEVPAAVTPNGQPIRLDVRRTPLFGHSQGSLNGPLFLATGPAVPGAVQSGAGGGLAMALIGKKKPVDIPALIIFAMNLEASEFDLSHPLIAVFQTFAERSDPVNFARRFASEAGRTPMHALYTQGLLDEYALPEQAAAMAAAVGCAPMAPIEQPYDVFALVGREPLTAPVAGNARGVGGEPLTLVMVQYPRDGHFAVFLNPDAKRHYLGFLEVVLRGGLPSVGP